MKNKFLIKIFFCFILISHNYLEAKISNTIVVKVGTDIITNYDLENEIRTLLFISNQPLNQENINLLKSGAIENLIINIIKEKEIVKYDVIDFNGKDLENFLNKIARNFKIPKNKLKEIFKLNDLNYDVFIKKQKIALRWNTLIYDLYRNQININTIELENDLQKALKKNNQKKKYNLAEIELPITKNINDVLDKIYEQIEREGFDGVAKKMSISASSLEGGKIGWISQDALSSIFFSAIENLKKGQISKPIKRTDSIVLLKVEDIKIIKNNIKNVNELKNKIITNKKIKKLELFSKSHYSKSKSSTMITFNEK